MAQIVNPNPVENESQVWLYDLVLNCRRNGKFRVTLEMAEWLRTNRSWVVRPVDGNHVDLWELGENHFVPGGNLKHSLVELCLNKDFIDCIKALKANYTGSRVLLKESRLILNQLRVVQVIVTSEVFGERVGTETDVMDEDGNYVSVYRL